MPTREPARRPRPERSSDAGQPTRDVLVRALDEAYRGPAWHGPSLRSTLRNCPIEVAARRVAPGRNTIWELLLHAAYGKHLGRARLTGERRRFAHPMARSWWPVAPAPSTAQWDADVVLLDDAHRALVEAVRDAPAARLARRRAGRRHTMAEEILGLALHDTYHGGQISLLRRILQP